MKKLYSTILLLIFLSLNIHAQDLLNIVGATSGQPTVYVQSGLGSPTLYVQGGIHIYSGGTGFQEDYLRNDGEIWIAKDLTAGQSDLTLGVTPITLFSSAAAIPSGKIIFAADNEIQGIYGGADAIFFDVETNNTFSPTIDNGCNDVITNNLNIGGSYFKMNANLISLYGTISGAGTLYGSSTSNLFLSGAAGGSVGTLTFAPGALQLGTLTVARYGASPSVTLGSDITINNILTLTSGIVNTGLNKIIIGNTAPGGIISGGGNTNYTTCWIDGNLRRQFISGTSGTFDFPVGNSSFGNLAQVISNGLSGMSYFDSKFQVLATGGSNINSNITAYETGLPATPYHTFYTSMNPGGSWIIEPDIQPASGNYDIQLYFNGFTGLSDYKFGELKRPFGSTTYADFKPYGGTLNSGAGLGRLVSDGYALRMGLTTFSEFAIGQSGVGLPIELTSFTGKNIGTSNILYWSTSSEINSDYFSVEHSFDAINFEELGTQKAAGASLTEKNYNFNHVSPASTINYYRLKSFDKDGSFSNSNIIAIDNSNNNSSVIIYPNPALDFWNIQFSGSQLNQSLVIQLTDVLGKEFFKQKIIIKEGTNNYILNSNNLSAGTYFVSIIDNDSGKNQTYKIIKVGKD